MKRILYSFLVLASVGAVVVSSTRAYFSDSETSTGNTFTAGSIDLNVDGGNTNVVKFNLTNLTPGYQPTGSWTLKNVGSVNGFLDVENISFTSSENGCVDPESDASDTTCGNPGIGEGELQDLLDVNLYIDRDNDGYYSTGDTYIYQGLMKNMPASLPINEPLNAGVTKKINAVINWFQGANDNKAMGDGVVLNMTFELGQTSGQ